MTPRARHHALDSVALQLHAWKPFDLHSSPSPSPLPSAAQLCAKKPCRSDRSTLHSELDLSRLSLLDDARSQYKDPHGLLRIARKRRRRGVGSRSISGRSSDRSGTRRAACATCSDFHLAAGGTDSSGEFFVNGDASWGSDASEAMRVSGMRAGEGKDVAATSAPSMERESSCSGSRSGSGSGSGSSKEGGPPGPSEPQGNDSGYGSEPGYRGDAELGYDDEMDDEEDDGRLLFWGGSLGDHMEVGRDSSFSEQKAHYRCRRKKQG